MALPLRIFEPRYQEMIDRCLDEEIGFGVVLIKEGEEVGGPVEPYSVGTIARILKSDKLPDGQMNLVTMGVVRFRILQTHDIHPYLSGDIERWEEDMGEVAQNTSHAAIWSLVLVAVVDICLTTAYYL